jgi:hypothetical protein
MSASNAHSSSFTWLKDMALYFDILLFSHNLAKDRIYADK